MVAELGFTLTADGTFSRTRVSVQAVVSESKLDRPRAAEEGAELDTATSNTTSASRFWISSGGSDRLDYSWKRGAFDSGAKQSRAFAVRWFINPSRELHDEDSGRGQR